MKDFDLRIGSMLDSMHKMFEDMRENRVETVHIFEKLFKWANASTAALLNAQELSLTRT